MSEVSLLFTGSYFFVAFIYGAWAVRSGGELFVQGVAACAVLMLIALIGPNIFAPIGATLVGGMVSYWAVKNLVEKWPLKKKSNISLSKT